MFVKSKGLSPVMSEILINRNIHSLQECESFLSPQLTDLHDPFKLMDMEKTIKRILIARQRNEKIYLYGDYDADGTVGVAILYCFLKRNGFNVCYYLPNRLITGYGLHKDPLRELMEKGMDLLITIDNGISAIDEVNFCKLHGIDVIITDHHECPGLLPEAYSIINPKRPDCPYPFIELCGAGVVFKLIQGLSSKFDDHLNESLFFQEMIECVALATVADLVPLRGENRTLVYLGLSYLNTNPQNKGLEQLIKVSQLDQVKAWHFGFILGPKINAAGRLGQADKIVELLTTDDEEKAYHLAEFLSSENRKRQDLEKDILDKALKQIEEKELFNKDLIIVYGEDWHSGVIGIVASRIQEFYYRPVIIISISNKVGKASCRSIEGFNIFAALSFFDHLFLSFGGHEQAAGFTIACEDIGGLEKAMEDYTQKINLKAILYQRIYYDQRLAIGDLNFSLYEELALVEPCGIKNPGIQFLVDNPPIKSWGRMGKDKNHLWVDFDTIRGVGFNMGDLKILEERPVKNFSALSFIVKLTVNEYRGNRSLQLQIKDIKVNPLHLLNEAKRIFNYLKEQEKINFNELNQMIRGLDLKNLEISREQLRRVYRFLKANEKRTSICLEAFYQINLNLYQTLMSLEILKENNLIDYFLNENVIKARILPVSKKKDINNSPLMIKLKKIVTLKEP